MHCTVREARERVTSKDFTDYVTFKTLFPWSYDAAFLACLISNLVRGKNDEPRSVSDFMPADIEEIDPLDATWENFHRLADLQAASADDG